MAKTDLRGVMPTLAGLVAEKRVQWGRAWVDDAVRRGMAGEVGWFYGFEAGRVVGTPCELMAKMAADYTFMVGPKACLFMRGPAHAGAAGAG